MEQTAAPKPDPGAELLNTQGAAALLELTVGRIRQLVTGGWIAEAGKGKYRVDSVVRGYVRFLKDEERRTSKTSSASAAQQARAEEIKVRTDERTGRLLREAQTEAIDVLSEFAGGLLSDLHAIPARVTMDLKQRAKIAQDIDRAFDDAARKAAAAANLVGNARERLEAARGSRPKALGRKQPKIQGKHRPSRAEKP